MSNGIHAIKGFDYQATVILDVILEHFDRYGVAAEVRPEGNDDLDLHWTEGAVPHLEHLQIKKPREDEAGNRKPLPWTLAQVVEEILPNTIAHLEGTKATQVWILGDEIHQEVQSLSKAARDAPSLAPKPYWKMIHLLARDETLRTHKVETSLRTKLLSRKKLNDLPADIGGALTALGNQFEALAQQAGAGDALIAQYRQNIARYHACLPEILARTTIKTVFGSEQEVSTRVSDRLVQHYELSPTVIKDTVFRNLRGFISDISKQAHQKFGHAEFEIELRCVWPHMIPVREPPPLEPNHIKRRDLADRLTREWTGRAIEVVGISGSGKTSLAAEVAERSRLVDPNRAVYYAQVMPEERLRDVLAGVAFHLRRTHRLRQSFEIAIDPTLTEEQVLSRLARAYSNGSSEFLLLIDLVEGTCSAAFARDLVTFVRELSLSGCRLAIFGQESALRAMTPLEKEQHQVGQLYIRGFSLEEFIALAHRYHPNADRAALSNVYQRLTAGRATGLYAGLAHALVRTESVQKMAALAAMPPDRILPEAERQRFSNISPGARAAAEKLVCFALPFQRQEAEQIFPSDNVGLAVRELIAQGLLRAQGTDFFEMHEMVRAGLEESIALNVRRSAHAALAAWYKHEGAITAAILHLDKADQSTEAGQLARTTFLRGEHWGALANYVIDGKLVSGGEVIEMVAAPKRLHEVFWLPTLLRALADATSATDLMRLIREQPARFYTEFQWGLALTETILELEPGRLHELLVFAVQTWSGTDHLETALGWILIGAQRKYALVEPQTLIFFNAQEAQVKRLLLPFLLLDGRRVALQAAFMFLAADADAPHDHRRRPTVLGRSLKVNSLRETLDVLAAIPPVLPAAMVNAKSALLAPLASLLESQRQVLRVHCAQVLEDPSADAAVLQAAIRVLIHLGEPSLCALCEPLVSRSDAVSVLAKLVPAISPSLCDQSLYERRLLDDGVAINDRHMALTVLASVAADLGDLYRRLMAEESDPKAKEQWNFLFLMACVRAPFAEGIPLLERHLSGPGDGPVMLAMSVLLTKLGELPTPAATQMLTRALSHANARVRLSAAVALGSRRAASALPSLTAQCEKESDQTVAVALARAIAASGAESASDIRTRFSHSSMMKLWQCILAARTRDASYAGPLVTLATDPGEAWHVRRAAIFAAGRLPYETALEKMLPAIMRERSPLALDRHADLLGHSVMSLILMTGGEILRLFEGKGRVEFDQYFEQLIKSGWGMSALEGLPAASEAADWLFERLAHHGWPGNPQAITRILDELHIPILQSAVLRALRLAGRADLIEEQLKRADHVWFAMKCVLERWRAGSQDPQLADRLQVLVDATACNGHWQLKGVIREIRGATIPTAASAPPVAAPEVPPGPSVLTYTQAVNVLSGTAAPGTPKRPLHLESLTQVEVERLAVLVDPANDHHHGNDTFLPLVQFTSNGPLVSQRHTTSSNEANAWAAALRAALAAANRFSIVIPWHDQALNGPLRMTYVPQFLECLGALSDADRFYEELDKNADALLPFISDPRYIKLIGKHIDARMVPFLSRYGASGTDERFEGLCMLAALIPTAEIDPVLAGLFHRWTGRFYLKSLELQHPNNYPLWRGFRGLTDHPRFGRIDAWQSSLATVLRARLNADRRQAILRVFERDPRAYLEIESQLSREENWVHIHVDEIDRLDDAGERLFAELLEK